MKSFNDFLSFIWRYWVLFLTTIGIIIFGGIIMIPLILIKVPYPYIYFWLRAWGLLVFYGSGNRISLNTTEKLKPNQPSIYISNHTSILDIMLMLTLVKQPMVFVGKKELVSYPIFGWIYKKISILVDRDNANSRLAVKQQVKEKLGKGISVCIFPEGGVPEPKINLDDFKDGPFLFAKLSHVPIVVYTFCGVKKCFPFEKFKGKPSLIKVFLEDFIAPKKMETLDTRQLNTYCRDLIYTRLKSCGEIE